MPSLTCPLCGEIEKSDVMLFDVSLQKQKIEILPVHATCNKCRSSVKLKGKCHNGSIIVLNGTCGSGKSTVAAELMKRFHYYAIDGDCAIQVIKHKLKKNDYSLDEILDEIASEIDFISLFNNKIVLSHIILPEDMDKYIKIFKERKLDYYFFLLKPDYDKVLERCKKRTCHEKPTPEYWTKHFYDRLIFNENVIELDNTDLSIEEAALNILSKAY